MSRPAAPTQPRALSLTEELEKLEQSITLTLQEIDHNFSRAHRIVTSSILPIVEQYGNHSRDVGEGSKFWKQFFESSANVSLSGYEEPASLLDTQEETVTEDTTDASLETSNTYDTPTAQHISIDSIQDIEVSNLTISPSQSTPRPTKKTAPRNQTTNLSQNESLYSDDQITGTITSSTHQHHHTRGPQTPGKPTSEFDSDTTPQSSPFLPPQPTSIPRPATPLSTSRFTNRLPPSAQDFVSATPTTTARNRTAQLLGDDSILSSPPLAAPELHAEIFSSPERKPARTPGVSVLPRSTKANNKTPMKATKSVWDDTDDLEDDDDDLDVYGHSPPKTMQFHIPQRRLLKTPAKEASQRIVQDLLTTAGMGKNGHIHDDDGSGDFSDEIDIDLDLDMDNSPSVIRQAASLEDDTF